MPIAFVKNGGGNADKAGNLTGLAVTVPAGGHAVGNLVVVFVGFRPISGTVLNPVTDDAGNSYTLIEQGGSGTLDQMAIYASILTTALTAGQFIRTTWNTSFPANRITVQTVEFSGASLIEDVASVFVQGSAAPSVGPITPPSAATLLLAGVVEMGTTTVTEDADAVGGDSWHSLPLVSTSGGSATSNVVGNCAYKITTSSAAQTYNPTIGTARAYASSMAALRSGAVTRPVTPANIAATSTVGGSFLKLPPLIDDFNRADGAIYAGAGAAIWTNHVISNTSLTNQVVSSNQLSGNTTCVSAIQLAADFDFIIDCAVAPPSGQGINFYWGMTNSDQAAWNGLNIGYDYGSAAWWGTTYTAGGGQSLGSKSDPAIAAGNSYWFHKVGSGISLYKGPSSSGPWTLVGTWSIGVNYGGGQFGIGPTETVQRWDNLRGGPPSKAVWLARITATSTVSGGVSKAAVVKAIVPAAIAATSSVSGNVSKIALVKPANVAATSTVGGAVRAVSIISLGWVPPYSSYGDGGYGQLSYGGMNVFGVTLLSIKVVAPAQINATSTVSGGVRVLHAVAPANIAATSSVSGTVRVLRKVAGQISAASTVSAALTKITGVARPIIAAPINATSVVSASIGKGRAISGAISAASTVSGSIRKLAALRGAVVAATSTVSAVLGALRRVLPAQISATSVVSGSIVRRAAISGQISAVSTVSGQIKMTRGILPTQVSATSTVTGRVAAIHKLVTAQISATSTVAGSITTHPVKFISGGVVSATSTVSGSVRALRRVLPTQINATSTVSGNLVSPKRFIVAAQINATSTVSGRVVKVFFVRTAAIAATSTVSGNLVRPVRPISGLISATSTVSGKVTVLRRLFAANIGATSTVSARVTARRPISAQIVATSTVTGKIVRRVSVTGQIFAISVVTGQVTPLRGVLPAVIFATSTVSAALVVVGSIGFPGDVHRVLSAGEPSNHDISSTLNLSGSMLSAGQPANHDASSTANSGGSLLSTEDRAGHVLST